MSSTRPTLIGLLAAALSFGAVSLPAPAAAQQVEPEEPALPPGLGEDEEVAAEAAKQPGDFLPAGLHGFAEARLGPRLGSDPAHSEDATVAELRFQADYRKSWKGVSLDAKGDLVLDAVTDEIDGDVRQLRATVRPGRSIDLRLGRQIMTWGTGDLLFINDLFPKDWQSFLAGRDEEYLKTPADAIRLGWFGSRLNLDLVYTPEFEPDRFIRGERISFYSPIAGGFVGDDPPLVAAVPGDIFSDDEIAVRLYGNIGSYEIAGYGYRGFWKSPIGFDPLALTAQFPRLDVLGASLRGPAGPGIGNVELGYYDSPDDNSELRLLVGYELELARELTGGFQYYVERRVDHDENRHVFTFRLTRLLMSQNLTLSLFAFVSPSDDDGYLRPKATYKLSDFWTLELGLNVFYGAQEQTFFGRFENNSNVYGSVRFSL